MADDKGPVVFHANPLAQLDEVLGGSVTDFAVNPDTYSPANRPQDIRYEFPDRGAESHGVNDDALSSQYVPNQVDGDPRIVTDTGHSTSLAMELVPVDPVAVYEVPHPQRSIRRYTQINTLFDGGVVWTGGALSGVDMSTVVPISADESRVKIQFILARSVTAFANQVNIWYAVSTDPSFSSYVILEAATSTATTLALTLENCKEALYVAVIPISAYDNTKTARPTLAITQEFAAPIDHNPAEA